MASLLGKFRIHHNTVYAIGEEMPTTGPAGAAAVMSFRHRSTAGDEHVSIVLPALPIGIYATLGHIAARWPILELYIDEMTKLLTAVTGGDPEMRGIYNAKRRLAYHEEQFALALTGYPNVIAYHQAVMKIVHRVKRVRDYVGHAQIVGQPTPKGFSVRFVDHSIKGNREKRYTDDDLMKIASEISHAAGFLDALARGDAQILRLSSREISALQLVLGADRWSEAIGRALKIPHRP